MNVDAVVEEVGVEPEKFSPNEELLEKKATINRAWHVPVVHLAMAQDASTTLIAASKTSMVTGRPRLGHLPTRYAEQAVAASHLRRSMHSVRTLTLEQHTLMMMSSVSSVIIAECSASIRSLGWYTRPAGTH